MSACSNCGGTGRVISWIFFSKTCPECDGSGTVIEVKNPYHGLRPPKPWPQPSVRRDYVPADITVGDIVDDDPLVMGDPLITVIALEALNQQGVDDQQGQDAIDNNPQEKVQEEPRQEDTGREDTPVVEAEPQTFTPAESDTTRSEPDSSPSYDSPSDSGSSDSGSSDSGSSGGE